MEIIKVLTKFDFVGKMKIAFTISMILIIIIVLLPFTLFGFFVVDQAADAYVARPIQKQGALDVPLPPLSRRYASCRSRGPSTLRPTRTPWVLKNAAQSSSRRVPFVWIV